MKRQMRANSETTLKKTARMNLSGKERESLARLMSDPIAYMPDERFSKPTVMAPIMERSVEVVQGVSLTGSEEETLFLQLNYIRHQMGMVRRRLLRQAAWHKSDVRELLDLEARQLEARSKIVTANMGLVLAMAQRVEYPGVEFTDLISEGSMALLRATEKFDVSRGIKFSTYACRAIFKAFSRAAKQIYRHRSRYPAQLDLTLEKSDFIEVKREETHEDWVDELRDIVEHNRAELSSIEISVVELRFSIDEPERKPLTLKEVGAKLGLTKERIRQIQNKALDKLRQVAEERMAPV